MCVVVVYLYVVAYIVPCVLCVVLMSVCSNNSSSKGNCLYTIYLYILTI